MIRARGALAVAVAALLAGACDAPAAPADARTSAGAAAGAQAGPPPPVDQLAPGELTEGTDRAFGLTLPQGVKVAEAFVSVAYASGPLTVHPVVQYLRARLDGGDLREGSDSATFTGVTVRGRPGVVLTIDVDAALVGVRLVLRDTTPVPAPNVADEAARWRRVGLTPGGRVLDPTHLD